MDVKIINRKKKLEHIFFSNDAARKPYRSDE
jgi:hypothetical protein